MEVVFNGFKECKKKNDPQNVVTIIHFGKLFQIESPSSLYLLGHQLLAPAEIL